MQEVAPTDRRREWTIFDMLPFAVAISAVENLGPYLGLPTNRPLAWAVYIILGTFLWALVFILVPSVLRAGGQD